MSDASIYATVLSQIEDIEDIEKVVVSLSGGLDSSIMLHLMTRIFGPDRVAAISFNYNQRHDVELYQARRTTTLLGVQHQIIDISFLGKIAAGVSSMVKGDVATPTMEDILGDPQPTTYMPNRNMILASLTAAFAESIQANAIALGIQKIDSYSYWDTTPEFYEAIENVFLLNRKNPIRFLAPFLSFDKSDEIRLGRYLGVDFGMTWTCYNPTITRADDTYEYEPAGGRNAIPHYSYKPCGVCPSCMERKQGFWRADNTVDTLVEVVV